MVDGINMYVEGLIEIRFANNILDWMSSLTCSKLCWQATALIVHLFPQEMLKWVCDGSQV
jgi:hypothetical protein